MDRRRRLGLAIWIGIRVTNNTVKVKLEVRLFLRVMLIIVS